MGGEMMGKGVWEGWRWGGCEGKVRGRWGERMWEGDGRREGREVRGSEDGGEIR